MRLASRQNIEKEKSGRKKEEGMKAQTLRRTSSQGPSKMTGADVPILFLEK